MENPSSEALFSQAKYAPIRRELLGLLSYQIYRYTGGESSSVPEELARELLESICYCLDISPENPDGRWDRLLSRDVPQAYQDGLTRAKDTIRLCQGLLRAVRESLPACANTSLFCTLEDMENLPKKYDPAFFAHRVPCVPEYPLALPVSESVLGINYIAQYLARLLMENRFLGEYAPGAVLPVLEVASPDYEDLPFNLFEPVLHCALGLALLDQPDRPLRIRPRDLDALYDLFRHMSRADIQGCLLMAAEKLLSAHPALGQDTGHYLSQAAALLAPRIDLLRDTDGLGGIFPVP